MMKREENVLGEKGDRDFQGWGTGLYRVKSSPAGIEGPQGGEVRKRGERQSQQDLELNY